VSGAEDYADSLKGVFRTPQQQDDDLAFLEHLSFLERQSFRWESSYDDDMYEAENLIDVGDSE